MLKKGLTLFFLILSQGCIDPYSAELPENPGLLMVNANISTQPNLTQVRISRTARYGSSALETFRPETAAKVAIRNQNGESIFLEEQFINYEEETVFVPFGTPVINRGRSESTSIYSPPKDFIGKVGEVYILEIILNNGERYLSFPEPLQAVPHMDSVSVRTRIFPSDLPFGDRSGALLMAHFQDPREEQNFYYWQISPGGFVVNTRPDLYTIPRSDTWCPGCPAPKDCCNRCYVEEFYRQSSLVASADRSFNGLNTMVPTVFIEDNGTRFQERYKTNLQQVSISSGAYRYFNLIRQQQEISGSVFDPPPAFIRGNMYNTENSDEVVIGYFFANDVHSLPVDIRPSDLDVIRQAFVLEDDCREYNDGARTEFPEDWDG